MFWGIGAVGSAPHWQCGGHGFESRMLHHVGVSFMSLTPTFFHKSECAHAAAPPFQIKPAALSFDLASGKTGKMMHLYCFDIPK